MRIARLLFTVTVAVALAYAGLGCGSKFPVPTESRGSIVPKSDAYRFRGSLEGVSDATDVMITRSSGNQLLIVLGANVDTRDSCSQAFTLTPGRIEMYPIFPPPNPTPLSVTFAQLWRPRLVSENGGRLFVYDAGDTCGCSPDSLPRVFGYQIGNPTPLFSIVDTSISDFTSLSPVVWVDIRGLAVADDRTVYVSGTFKVVEPDENDFLSPVYRERIWRYKEVSTNVYERDMDWQVLTGTGLGFVGNHQGIAWGPPEDPFLWVVDGEKQAVQKMIIEAPDEGHGLYAFDGILSGERFGAPTDVGVDADGFVYVVDPGTARALRYEDLGTSADFVQVINDPTNVDEPVLALPDRVAVLDTIVYVSDPPMSAARRYERDNR